MPASVAQRPGLAASRPLAPGEVYVNFGFWGTVPLPAGRADGYHNRLVEDEVAALAGTRACTSTSFYTQEQFWASYNGPGPTPTLKERYDGGGPHWRLALYEKWACAACEPWHPEPDAVSST